MKTMTEARFKIVKLACPNATIESRDGEEVVVIPTYDIESDSVGESLFKLIRDVEPEAKFKPGDTLTHTKTGTLFDIVDPFRAFLKLRKGPKAHD